MAFLDIQNLSIDIDLPSGKLFAVRDISLKLERGQSLGVVGESGSGKSLTALALMRLLPKAANVQADVMGFDGIDLPSVTDGTFGKDILGARISMIFQEPMTSLNPVYSIGRQLTEASVRTGHFTHSQAKSRALDLLARVGIPEPKLRMQQYPHQLSGGQRQRVMIAMALMLEPEVLIADEPTTALDVTVQAQIMDLLSDLRREMGMAMILITHDLAVVSSNVDKIAVMYGGEIVEQGDAAAVLSQPSHPYTRALLNAIPRLDGDARELQAIPGTVPSLMAPPTACVFAPRCAEAKPVCTQHRPPNVGTIAHMRRCILTDDDIAKMVAAVPAVVAERAQVKDDVVLSASHVTRVFQTRTSLFAAKHEIRAVDNVSLDIHRGETLALVGESGSGKSTLSKILLGLDAPTTGSVLLAGEPVTQMQPAKRAGLVQPIFQDPYSSLNPRRTLAEIIARPLVLRGEKSSADNLKSAREMLDMVRLPARLLYSYPSQLSGGQRQRVAIARALITSPKMLICDEPTSALDVSVQAQILTLLGDLQRNLHLTCMIITHDMAVVHQIADRVAVMLSGQIVELGTAHDVFGSPSNSYTKSLLAAAPQFKQDTVLA